MFLYILDKRKAVCILNFNKNKDFFLERRKKIDWTLICWSWYALRFEREKKKIRPKERK